MVAEHHQRCQQKDDTDTGHCSQNGNVNPDAGRRRPPQSLHCPASYWHRPDDCTGTARRSRPPGVLLEQRDPPREHEPDPRGIACDRLAGRHTGHLEGTERQHRVIGGTQGHPGQGRPETRVGSRSWRPPSSSAPAAGPRRSTRRSCGIASSSSAGRRKRLGELDVRFSRPSPRALLAAILAIAALVRFGVFLLRALHHERFLERDSFNYLTLAKNMGAFSSKSNPDFALSVLRTPGYPSYLYVTHLLTDSHVIGPMILQVLLGVVVVYLTYRLGLQLFSQSVGLFAAGIIAVDPLSIVYSSLVLSELLFTLFLTAAVVLLWRPSGNDWRRGLAAGLLLGLATLTRPESLYLSVVLALCYLALERRHLRDAAVVAICFLIGFAVPAGGWIVRNYEATGVAMISSDQGFTLLYYGAAPTLQESDHISLAQARSELAREVARKLPPHANPGRQNQAEQSLAISVIKKHPAAFLKESLSGAGRLMFSGNRAEFPASGATVSFLLKAYHGAYLLCLYLLVAAGLWAAWRRDHLRSSLMPVVTIVYTVALTAGLEAYSRSRAPLMPFFALLAGIGGVALLRAGWGGNRNRSSGADEPPTLSANRSRRRRAL